MTPEPQQVVGQDSREPQVESKPAVERPEPTSPPSLPPSYVVLHMPRAALWILAAAVIAPWVWMIALPQGGKGGKPWNLFDGSSALPRTESKTVYCKSGPWGEMEYTRILIEPPEEFVMANYDVPQQARWFFKGYSADALRHFLQTAGLNSNQLQTLTDSSHWEQTVDGIWVKPPKDLVLNMGGEARARLYTALAAFTENSSQNEPFRFRADVADEWFEDSGLSDETIALVKRLLYRRGSTLCFSDHEVILPLINSPQEKSRLVKTLARKSTMLLKLRVRPDSDIESISKYWAKGYRAKDIRPILQSAAHHADGVTVDVAHLMPKFARSLLYTYPLPTEDPAKLNRDCHWTSLNFFSEDVDDRYSDIEVVRQTLQTQYHPVPGDLALGDILIFLRPGGVVIHSCVYVADDIVFTKNGASFAMPWILMALDDVLAFYPSAPPLEVRRYRANKF